MQVARAAATRRRGRRRRSATPCARSAAPAPVQPLQRARPVLHLLSRQSLPPLHSPAAAAAPAARAVLGPLPPSPQLLPAPADLLLAPTAPQLAAALAPSSWEAQTSSGQRRSSSHHLGRPPRSQSSDPWARPGTQCSSTPLQGSSRLWLSTARRAASRARQPRRGALTPPPQQRRDQSHWQQKVPTPPPQRLRPCRAASAACAAAAAQQLL